MAQKTSIPKGTRDFGPEIMHKRNYIFNTIREVYQLYGFQPLETPAMENLSTLTGKYGEEGDQLLFKILNSGDYLKKSDNLAKETSSSLTSKIAEKGLRYDLTVPFARYITQHQHEISFPFKRYQIQPVWRADRPQKGRYREFYQCDADVIGMNALFSEAELIKIIDEVFQRLNIKVTIKINNRKILYGIAESIGAPEHFKTLTVVIDKLEKIGIEKVFEELKENGVPEEACQKLKPVLMFNGSLADKTDFLKSFLTDSETGLKGIDESEEVFRKASLMDIQSSMELDLTLARGLDYYTGAIFEVITTELEMGSICGGGRYDDLTGVFGLKNVSGVGISFGAERIFDVMEELKRFPPGSEQAIKVMVVNFGEEAEEEGIKIVQKLRANAIKSEFFPKPAKMKKQMNFANSNNIPYVIMAGEEELKSQKLTLKNMETGEQQKMSFEDIIDQLQ
ncbi:MAG: histidine--tRNA ligase [Bacteroidota bacterium]